MAKNKTCLYLCVCVCVLHGKVSFIHIKRWPGWTPMLLIRGVYSRDTIDSFKTWRRFLFCHRADDARATANWALGNKRQLDSARIQCTRRTRLSALTGVLWKAHAHLCASARGRKEHRMWSISATWQLCFQFELDLQKCLGKCKRKM